MKKLLSSPKTVIVLSIVTILLICFCMYMFNTPISYGAGYSYEVIYEEEAFEGTMYFYPNGTLINKNTNFEETMKSRYYYKDGYVFFTLAQTDEEYQEEVAYINNNFEEAVNAPFYAATINAFKMIAVGVDGYQSIYTCNLATLYAVVCIAVVLAMAALTFTSLKLSKKAKAFSENTAE